MSAVAALIYSSSSPLYFHQEPYLKQPEESERLERKRPAAKAQMGKGFASDVHPAKHRMAGESKEEVAVIVSPDKMVGQMTAATTRK